MCSYPNTSALSEQIDSAGSLTVDNVVSLSFLGLDINIEGSHILDRDGGLDLFHDSGVCDAVFGVILDDKVGDNGFFAGLPGNSLFDFFNNRLCGCAFCCLLCAGLANRLFGRSRIRCFRVCFFPAAAFGLLCGSLCSRGCCSLSGNCFYCILNGRCNFVFFFLGMLINPPVHLRFRWSMKKM